MCLALVGFRTHPVAPVVVAANRDESFSRAARPPARWWDDPAIIAGQDLQEGGTWLGMTRWGVAGLNNYPMAPEKKQNSSNRRSRGLLLLDLLRTETIDQAIRLGFEAAPAHNPFLIYLVGPGRAALIDWNGVRPRCLEIQPGWYAFGNERPDLQNGGSAKVRHIRTVVRADVNPLMDADELARILHRILGSHWKPDRIPEEPRWFPPEIRLELASPCVHTPVHGTRSCSVLMMGGTAGSRYWFADGPPCRTALESVPLA